MEWGVDVGAVSVIVAAWAENESGDGRDKDFCPVFQRDLQAAEIFDLLPDNLVGGVHGVPYEMPPPPSPGSLTANDKVSSTCLNRKLVLPNKSRTSTDRALRLVAREARDFAFKCQFLSVRSVTAKLAL